MHIRGLKMGSCGIPLLMRSLDTVSEKEPTHLVLGLKMGSCGIPLLMRSLDTVSEKEPTHLVLVSNFVWKEWIDPK
ncbi:hypothetical protein QE152_g27646 [Popillia japonica]|uniref:Uncharacterized protein n=1 Tax=Popillia japonica TaxID=7064 RepID=A0AAW1JRC7_POPJA